MRRFSIGTTVKPQTVIPTALAFEESDYAAIINNSNGSNSNVVFGQEIEIQERPIHNGSEEQQKIIDYAWQISHDEKFIYLLKAECGDLDIKCKSKTVGSNGYRDFGACQINKGYHSKIVNDARFFTDYKWQLDQCYRLYKGGTKFYGMNNIHKVKKHFTWTI